MKRAKKNPPESPRTAPASPSSSWLAAGAACAAFAAVLPVLSPDLYWHLSAGRRIVETGAIPTADWLTSRAGAPWTDFEWLGQLVLYGVERAGGSTGLWSLKAAAFGALFLLVDALSRARGLDARWRAAVLAAVAAGPLPYSEPRPELASLLAFAWLLLRLEQRRLHGRPLPAWAAGLLFAAWANVHAGYVYGLALLAAYGAWGPLAAAALGCWAQPHPLASFEVVLRHMRERGDVARYIVEWLPPDFSNPRNFPLAGLLGAAALGAAALAGAGALGGELRPALVLGALAFAAARHWRFGSFFTLAAAPAAAAWLARGLPAIGRAAPALVLAACALRQASLAGRAFPAGWPEQPPVAAATIEFLERERPALGPRVVYAHAWSWGGYLGWKLYPAYRVYHDGRYIFHDLLAETRRATSSPRAWQEFMDRRGLDLVLAENIPLPFELFFPPKAWALVHRDAKALLFVRRAAVDPAWLSRVEGNGIIRTP